jgi:hypothetical protein
MGWGECPGDRWEALWILPLYPRLHIHWSYQAEMVPSHLGRGRWEQTLEMISYSHYPTAAPKHNPWITSLPQTTSCAWSSLVFVGIASGPDVM